jgi:hypothetical protein
MSNMKSKLAATLLTLILTVPALAGNIGTPGCTPPPPPPPPACVSDVSASLPGLVNILIAVLSL